MFTFQLGPYLLTETNRTQGRSAPSFQNDPPTAAAPPQPSLTERNFLSKKRRSTKRAPLFFLYWLFHYLRLFFCNLWFQGSCVRIASACMTARLAGHRSLRQDRLKQVVRYINFKKLIKDFRTRGQIVTNYRFTLCFFISSLYF